MKRECSALPKKLPKVQKQLNRTAFGQVILRSIMMPALSCTWFNPDAPGMDYLNFAYGTAGISFCRILELSLPVLRHGWFFKLFSGYLVGIG
jgi:hypothetical protein